MPLCWVTNIFKRVSKKKLSIPKKIWQDPFYFLAFGFGIGTIPIAPGTFGTLLAIPLFLLLQRFSLAFYLFFVLLFIVFSMWVCERVSRDMRVHDHPGICIDEIAGFLVTMINAPRGWLGIGMGFFLFRLFDIWKPWPIRWVDQRVHGGLGIVLDDILAGIYTFFLLQFIKIYLRFP